MIRSFVSNLKDVLLLQSSDYYFGFVRGHDHYSDEDVEKIRTIILNNSKYDFSEQYEKSFAKIIGDGFAISYAAGRMAFYTLLKSFGIKDGDEILITGFTCSVMINAIIRLGAIPVYVDINSDDLGTDADDLEKKIGPRSKLIVAQHSFGIPCDIIKIAQIAKQHNLFLIEDCAITFGSEINGVTVGNFGDAAIFSTDHSKPVNTMIGGMLYTCSEDIYHKILTNYPVSEGLNAGHQLNLFERFTYERKYFNPRRYKRTKIISLKNNLKKKILGKNPPKIFLDKEESVHVSDINHTDYPYPATIPNFLAYIGLKELENWSYEKDKKVNLLKKAKDIVVDKNKMHQVPKAYFNETISIVPHRFIMFSRDKINFIRKFHKYIDTSWFWFEKPIVTTKHNLSEYMYKKGDCNRAEEIGKEIINLPVDITEEFEEQLMTLYKEIINYI